MKFLITIIFGSLVFTACNLVNSGDKPDSTGKIVFSAEDEEGTYQIFSMKGDGSNLQQLTNFPPDGGAYHPAWSPDGKRIVFANGTGATTLGPYLYIMDADGSNMRPLKKMESEAITALIGEAPSWSPDGTKIAFERCMNCNLGGSNYEIFIVEVEGEHYDAEQVQPLTDHPSRDNYPIWSPDGSQIAFRSNRDYWDSDNSMRRDIYIADAEGEKDPQRLTDTGFGGGYYWKNNDQLVLTHTDTTTHLKNILHLDVKSSSTTPFLKNLETKAQLWVFWSSLDQQYFMIHKNHKELPVHITSYAESGEVLIEHQLNKQLLKTGYGFDWFFTGRGEGGEN